MLHIRRPAGLTDDVTAAKIARALSKMFDEPVTFAPRPLVQAAPGAARKPWEMPAEPAPAAPPQPWDQDRAA